MKSFYIRRLPMTMMAGRLVNVSYVPGHCLCTKYNAKWKICGKWFRRNRYNSLNEEDKIKWDRIGVLFFVYVKQFSCEQDYTQWTICYGLWASQNKKFLGGLFVEALFLPFWVRQIYLSLAHYLFTKIKRAVICYNRYILRANASMNKWMIAGTLRYYRYLAHVLYRLTKYCKIIYRSLAATSDGPTKIYSHK